MRFHIPTWIGFCFAAMSFFRSENFVCKTGLSCQRERGKQSHYELLFLCRVFLRRDYTVEWPGAEKQRAQSTSSAQSDRKKKKSKFSESRIYRRNVCLDFRVRVNLYHRQQTTTDWMGCRVVSWLQAVRQEKAPRCRFTECTQKAFVSVHIDWQIYFFLFSLAL